MGVRSLAAQVWPEAASSVMSTDRRVMMIERVQQYEDMIDDGSD
jgi:hypothetical protein